MRIELKSFQQIAARSLLDELSSARDEVARRGKAQALVLSSPTGSGKTVTVTALMEWIYEGYESFPPDEQATFLWVSDAPELNAQSRDRIVSQSSVFNESMLVMVDNTFDAKYFAAGHVYFLNTQKLGKDSLLTRKGDHRTYSIWDTVQNTAKANSTHFFVIIDEAHRGMNESAGERSQATSIVQRLIKGWSDGGFTLDPVKLIIGMSATPERFVTLISGASRTERRVEIDPEDVRASGLLKDRIVLYHPTESQPSDMSLLEEATRRWQTYVTQWAAYCREQAIDRVIEPVLVIQVEDGNDRQLTRTDLSTVVAVVERVTGVLPDTAWAHAFQEDKTLEYAGHKIRKLEASKIESDPQVRIVLFKMSLTTGWDCPRAETMMSFRKAVDATLIAQLVGRMVRTPLARTIEGSDFLNSVALYLPYYDEVGLRTIVARLNTPDPETGPMVAVEKGTELVAYQRAKGTEDMFCAVEGLPSYRVERVEKTSNVRRVIKLARQLTTFDLIDGKALETAKRLVVKTLESELRRLSKRNDFLGNVAANQEIEVREVWVECGEWKELPSAQTVKIRVTPENVDDLFDKCKLMLGEGLHMDYWKARRARDGSVDATRHKLELYALLQEEEVWLKLEEVCGAQIHTWFAEHAAAIDALTTSRKEVYNRLRRMAKQPESEKLLVPWSLELKREQPEWDRHVFADSRGKFGAKLNTWETSVLKEEMSNPQFIGWLRNLPRKAWALCIAYKHGDDYSGLYPDMLMFRRVGGKVVVDVLDPHDGELEDAPFKAAGLAEYARQYGHKYGRIELARMGDDGKVIRLNVNDERVRDQVITVRTREELNRLFDLIGSHV